MDKWSNEDVELIEEMNPDALVTPVHAVRMPDVSSKQVNPSDWELIAQRAIDVTGGVRYEEIVDICGGSDKTLTQILRRVHCLGPTEYATFDHEERNIVLFMAITAIGEPCVQVTIKNLGHYFREGTQHRRSVS